MCGNLQDEYGKLFRNGHWHTLTDIPVPEGDTSPAQVKYNNCDPPHADGQKCYVCSGTHILPDCP